MATQQTPISNEVDDFVASSIYPGGTNTVTDARYALWDYGGTRPPNSECGLHLTLNPTDGSNEGKPHEEVWNMGSAKDFQPSDDGGHVLPVGSKTSFSQACNGFLLLKSLRDNCGMEKGRLSTPVGIKALIGSSLTLIRQPAPARDFKDNNPGGVTASGAPAAPKTPKEILVASKASFSWEKGGKGGRAAAPAAPAPAAGTVPVAPAPAAGDDPLTTAIASILAANDNAIMLAELGAKVTAELSTVQGISAAKRIAMMKRVNDPAKLAELATANGWEIDTAEGVLLIP